MTKKICFSLIFFAVFSLTGCQGFNDFFVSPNPPCTSNCSGGSGLGTSTTSGYFYVLVPTLSFTTAYIAEYQIVSSKLTPLGSNNGIFPLLNVAAVYTTSGYPTAITLSPNNLFLYVGMSDGGIVVFDISSGAIQTPGELVVAPTGYAVTSMQVDFTNSWLISANIPTATAATLTATPIVSTSGILNTSGSSYPATLPLATPMQIAISPNNNYVYIAMGTAGSTAIAFTASSTTTPFASTEVPLALLQAGASDNTIAVDPQSRFVYVGEGGAFSSGNNPGGLRMFNPTLTTCANSSQTKPFCEISGSPYQSGGIAPVAIVPDRSGEFVYVANQTVYNSSGPDTSSNISQFGIAVTTFEGNTTSSLISLGVPSMPTGTTTTALAVDSSNSFVFSVNAGGTPDLSIFSFYTAPTDDGELDNISPSTGTGTTFTGGTQIAVTRPN